MKKGFTLIELLAVILILGIISLIAVPQVTNTIEKSKKVAAEASAENYLTALSDYITLQGLKGNEIEDGIKNIDEIDVKIKGQGPTSGTFTVEKSKVKEANLVVNGYSVVCDNSGKCIASKENSNYVYFQVDAFFASLDQTVPTIPTTYNAYLKIDKNDITKIYVCSTSNGEELCLNPNAGYEISKQVLLNYFEFDETTWHQNSGNTTIWAKDDKTCVIDVASGDKNYTTCVLNNVRYSTYTNGFTQIKDVTSKFICSISYNSQYPRCYFYE